MFPRLWKICTGALALGLILLPGSGYSSSTESSWRPTPPDERHIAALEELSSWLGQAEEAASGTSLRLSQDLRKAIKRRSESFELLRAFNGDGALEEQLKFVPFGADIYKAAQDQGVDPLLLASLVEVESNFSPRAMSSKGAVGLTQVLPSTAGYAVAELHNPTLNLEQGATYLRAQLDRFGGDLELALAAYNAGPYAVKRFAGIPPYRETRRYVDKVLSIYVGHYRDLWQASTASDLLVH